jgi:hypothetical protein
MDSPQTSATPEGPSDIEGELLIESEPAGAVVTVNGIGRGRTPAHVRYLAAGSYTIRVSANGYESSQRAVTLTRENSTRRIRLVLSHGEPDLRVQGVEP